MTPCDEITNLIQISTVETIGTFTAGGTLTLKADGKVVRDGNIANTKIEAYYQGLKLNTDTTSDLNGDYTVGKISKSVVYDLPSTLLKGQYTIKIKSYNAAGTENICYSAKMTSK